MFCLRHSKTLANGDEEEYLWDGNNLVYVNPSLSEYLLTGFTAYYGLGIFESNQNGTKYRYQRNAHGDTTALLNQSGDIVRCYIYEDAFGTSTYSADDTNPFRYAGQYYDRESQSYYLRARYYLPRYGRFTAEDPARDGLNWYTYCANNPVKYVNFTGYWQESDADLPEGAQKVILYYTDKYENATSNSEREYWHMSAERVRANCALTVLGVTHLTQRSVSDSVCVLACIAMMINYYGYSYTVQQKYEANGSRNWMSYNIFDNLGIGGDFGITSSGSKIGTEKALEKCRLDIESGNPVMIQIAYGIEGKQTHSVVAYGFKGKGATLSSILILDPWQYQADHVDTGKPYTLQEMVDYFAKKVQMARI